ncbi:MAG: DUF362 domain-containing protein [Candidatus Aminicenantaceae bacterium]
MFRSRVVIVKSPGVLSKGGELDSRRLVAMYDRGFSLLSGSGDKQDLLQTLFKATDTVGIKVNTIGGRALSTRPETAAALSRCLTGAGHPDEQIIVWDRTNRELREAGFSLRMNRKGGPRTLGTDTQGVGYESQLVSHRSIGSLFSVIQARMVSASVSLAILKDHGLAGVTAGMKNYFGAIHNPNKYHDDHCDPYVAEVFESGPVKSKHRLTVVDALLVQFHRGPAYHATWAEPVGALIFSTDPVAADFTGWQLIERLRMRSGLPTLAEEEREPSYIHTASRMKLGCGRSEDIVLIEEVL